MEVEFNYNNDPDWIHIDMNDSDHHAFHKNAIKYLFEIIKKEKPEWLDEPRDIKGENNE